MQAFSDPITSFATSAVYAPDMRKKERPALGQRLADLRQAAGLTQMQLAEKLAVHHSNIAFWELSGTAPRGEVLPGLASALGVTVDELLGVRPPKPRRQPAKGRLQQVFEAASRLPRRQQDKIAEFVEAFVAQHREKNAA